MFKAYEDNKKAGNARLDFNDIIWNDDIRPIGVHYLGANGKPP